MAFSGQLLFMGPDGQYGTKIWSYSSDDSLATILSSGYFNDVLNKLSKNDVLLVNASDATKWLTVISASGALPVTCADFDVPYTIGSSSPVAMKSLYIKTDGGATASYPLTIVNKFRVLDVSFSMYGNGSSGDTIQVAKTNVGSPISNNADISGLSDNDLVGASSINTTNAVLNAGDVLVVLQTDGGGSNSPSVGVTVTGFYTA